MDRLVLPRPYQGLPKGTYEEGGLVDTQVGSETGGYGRCQQVISYGRKGGVTVLEGGRVLARGTGCCT